MPQADVAQVTSAVLEFGALMFNSNIAWFITTVLIAVFVFASFARGGWRTLYQSSHKGVVMCVLFLCAVFLSVVFAAVSVLT